MEQEEVLFEGQAGYTKPVLKEVVRAMFFKTFVLVFTLSVVVILVGIMNFTSGDSSTVIFICIGVGIAMPISIIATYNKQTKLLYAQCIEKGSGKELTNTVKFFDDKIVMTNLQTGNIETYPYSVIQRVEKSKNLIMFLSKAKLIIFVEKSTLAAGIESELIALVKSKIQKRF